jgi:hypothetical protein
MEVADDDQVAVLVVRHNASECGLRSDEGIGEGPVLHPYPNPKTEIRNPQYYVALLTSRDGRRNL